MSSEATAEGRSRSQISERLNTMVKSGVDWPDSSVAELIDIIDGALSQAEKIAEGKSKSAGINWKQSDSQGFKNIVKSIGKKISAFIENNIEIAVEVLNTIGECHWAAVGFVLVASALENIHTMKYNKKVCVKLLKSMNDLAKVVMELQPVPHLSPNTQTKITESLNTILDASISCWETTKRSRLKRWAKSRQDKKMLLERCKEIEESRNSLHLFITTSLCIHQLNENEKESKGKKRSVTDAEIGNEEASNKIPRIDDDRDLNESSSATQFPSITQGSRKSSRLSNYFDVTKRAITGSGFKRNTK